ncbi:Aminodeoxychorismate lyase [Lachnospiraceae bacterium TWA4]|nr:Aminodeoxychorismate lyase [Lachnospiraceae bacterium TWA4]
MTFNLDEGYFFGLGAFETIAVKNSKPILLDYHLERLKKAMKFFGIEKELPPIEFTNDVVKIVVSKENIVITTRENHYTEDDYQKGFRLDFSKVRRNETSSLVYHKTLNYGDNILEKRLATSRKIDEPIFLNTKGEIAEGACSNIFFVKGNKIYTPKTSCGLLEGTMRRYILEHYTVSECIIMPEEIGEFDEVFLTNALMGIMPVRQFEGYSYTNWTVTNQLRKEYGEFIGS